MSVSQMVNYFEVLYNTQPSNTDFATNEEGLQCTWQFEASVEADDAAFQSQLRRVAARGSTTATRVDLHETIIMRGSKSAVNLSCRR